eukprot:CAMPEP_0183555360 /NCGR_PEP_ID=MMETSP0371-20130417/79442_1 /TAXON_ID=268820 /ORGANISM="Peridinium aciculiferum, Strain PAER-2" /LENGTH=278 /DNA_ID=CAMNT_0025761531 /DNA_START=51 /DNA_END=887 /DNA_ORIENTATION=+
MSSLAMCWSGPGSKGREDDHEHIVRGRESIYHDYNEVQFLQDLVCGDCSLVEPDFDVVPQHEVESLLQESFVTHLPADPCLVDAELVGHLPTETRLAPEALVTPPLRLEIKITAGHLPGQVIKVQGPHCIFETRVPEGAEPGDELVYYLGPLPEFEVTVPAYSGPGSFVNITRDDGSAIRVAVPQGSLPGSTFCVEPPVLMVKAPDGSQMGDTVFFQRCTARGDEWFQVCIPGILRPCGYFAARLPHPRDSKKSALHALPDLPHYEPPVSKDGDETEV